MIKKHEKFHCLMFSFTMSSLVSSNIQCTLPSLCAKCAKILPTAAIFNSYYLMFSITLSLHYLEHECVKIVISATPCKIVPNNVFTYKKYKKKTLPGV